MYQHVSILGSTGSIGQSTLEVIRANNGAIRVVGLCCQRNIVDLAEQIREFHPVAVSVGDGLADELRTMLGVEYSDLIVREGDKGNIEVATLEECDLVVAAMVGAAGLYPVIEAVRQGKDIALANKETMVLAGGLIIKEAQSKGVKLLPVDSEHNAIFQCIRNAARGDVKYITLTASGGPFRTRPLEEFDQITVDEALRHPNWDMGAKITIDSATMMNKCLEIIEAKWLFDLPLEKIRVIVHPQSIVHSFVTFLDGSTLAQMGCPDMKIPISYCLGHPDRIPSNADFLDVASTSPLTFHEPDYQRFPTLQFAFRALKMGGGSPAALNGANEVLVSLFLEKRVSFTEIFRLLEVLINYLEEHSTRLREKHPFLLALETIEDAISADQWGRQFIVSRMNGKVDL